PIWWMVPVITNRPPVFKETAMRHCGYCAKSNKKKSACFSCLLKLVKKARRTKKIQRFTCPAGLSGFCLPVSQGSEIYGYIGVCHSGKNAPEIPLQLFAGFVGTLLKNIQKELELNKVCETIKPRAIALSTVHTIHRLISSTLDLDELLSRVARLSMQVMQANRCSVKLLDVSKDVLRPVVTVDRRTKRKLRPKKLRLGSKIPGRAAKHGKVLRGESYLSVPLVDNGEIVGVITIYDKLNEKPFTQFDQEIMMTIGEQAVIAINNAKMYKEQENLAISGIKSLATVLDARGPDAFVPTTTFVKIVLATGQRIGLDRESQRTLHFATLLHDAGQVFVPDEILSKPGGLTGDEYNMIKEHPATSAKMVEPMKHLRSVIPIILHHHENFDDTGYPGRLKGEQIPLGSRVMAIAGAFMSMITAKPYRITKTIDEAASEIRKHSGTQFDPEIVKAFCEVINQKEIRSLLDKEYGYGFEQAHQGSDIF
ncbi:MAG: HD domain-containing phosphohydrolase, partial [Candidatus Omnitrophota bacterium]